MALKHKIGFVYIHGAGLGSYIWDGITDDMNIPGLAIEYPGRSPGETMDPNLRLSDYAAHAISQIEKWEVNKFIIVAHSIGGSIGLMAAEALGDRVVGFVGIGATIPRPGGSFVSVLPFPQSIILPFLLRIVGTRPPDNIILTSLCHGLSDEEKQLVLKNFIPESRYLFTDPCPAPVPDVYKIYIELLEDKELTRSTQLRMVMNLRPSQIIEISSGHLPMISHKKEIISMLRQVHLDISKR